MTPWSLDDLADRWQICHDLSDEEMNELCAAAAEAGHDVVQVDAEVAGLFPFGVVRASVAKWLGPSGGRVADRASGLDAAGEGSGARSAMEALCDAWDGGGEDSFGPAEWDPDDEAEEARRVEIVARWVAACCDLAPRVVVLRNAHFIDEHSARTFGSMLAGRAGGGLLLVLDRAPEAGTLHPLSRLVGSLALVADDDRGPIARPHRGRATPASKDADPHDLPVRGTAVELLDMLRAWPGPIPAVAVATACLSTYRGRHPRGGWMDLESILDSAAARCVDGIVFVRPGTAREGVLREADRAAMGEAVDAALEGNSRLRRALLVRAAISQPVGGGDPGGDPGGDLLAHGEWCRLAARGPATTGFAAASRRLGRAADALAAPASPDFRERRERALLQADLGQETTAAAALEGLSAELDHTDPQRAALLFLAGRLQNEHDPVKAAATLAEAARAEEQHGNEHRSARVFALRAVCMAAAGAGDRALKELRLAMDRALTEDSGDVAVIDVRILAGMVFRDAGHRDKARPALQLAVDKAALHALPDRQALALINLARLWVEGLPPAGPARGEAMGAARDAADQAVRLARGLDRPDLEAAAEAVLAELSARVDDHAGAVEILGRVEALYRRAGRLGREVDTALRRARLLLRDSRFDDALAAAAASLQVASRRRMTDRAAQSQMVRGEALDGAGRRDEALAALTEAHRLWKGLGLTAQAEAAEQRARQLLGAGRARG